MASTFGPKNLSSIINIQTSAPFPVLNTAAAQDANAKLERPSDSSKVNLKVCSEFTSYTAQLTAFNSSEKISFVTDGAGQPLVAAVGEDKVSQSTQD